MSSNSLYKRIFFCCRDIKLLIITYAVTSCLQFSLYTPFYPLCIITLFVIKTHQIFTPYPCHKN